MSVSEEMKEVNVDELWETNAPKLFEPLKGAVLISAFIQGEKVRLFFLKDGKIIRVKIPTSWFGGPFEIKEVKQL